MADITPFTIAIPQAEIDDLRARLRATRWTDEVTDDWSQGTPQAPLRRLVEYWANDYDWRAAEARWNERDQVIVDGVHAVRAGTRGATPLLLLHGWPDGIVRFERALPFLAERFELVIPSIPGYGFSARPTEGSGPAVVADQMAGLMAALGFDRYGVHGADIGAQIAEQVALRHPDHVSGLHFGNVPLRRMRGLDPSEMTDAERAWATASAEWEATEGAYGHQQRTKPQTIGASLNDSPAGLASWMLEKFHAWSDRDGDDVFSVYTLDEIATNLSIYWFTQTAASAARYYFYSRSTPLTDGLVAVPTGVAEFPREILHTPRESAARWFSVVRWTDMERGGHFGPWEDPEAWSLEISAFFDQIGE